MAALLALTSCENLPPLAYGRVGALPPQDIEHAVAVARQQLAHSVAGYEIFRVWIVSQDEVHVYYRSYAGPARHLVLERVYGQWRVTGGGGVIDDELEEIIVT